MREDGEADGESLFDTVTIAKMVIVLLVIGIILIFLRVKKKVYRPNYDSKNMPANLWLYSQLVDIEVGNYKANYKNLYNAFVSFLCKKYKISKDELKNNSIFELVKKREESPDLLELYGEIWNSVEELKHKGSAEIVAYIKNIKPLFNKENVSEWIEIQKTRKPCNDC